mmetsp:Transcript_9578/g.17974  ORF Transcript_9578/g.17974 Transcript_9578/m.17974 type:complete len:315 (+) Transcript_9578:244-1188(+)
MAELSSYFLDVPPTMTPDPVAPAPLPLREVAVSESRPWETTTPPAIPDPPASMTSMTPPSFSALEIAFKPKTPDSALEPPLMSTDVPVKVPRFSESPASEALPAPLPLPTPVANPVILAFIFFFSGLKMTPTPVPPRESDMVPEVTEPPETESSPAPVVATFPPASDILPITAVAPSAPTTTVDSAFDPCWELLTLGPSPPASVPPVATTEPKVTVAPTAIRLPSLSKADPAARVSTVPSTEVSELVLSPSPVERAPPPVVPVLAVTPRPPTLPRTVVAPAEERLVDPPSPSATFALSDSERTSTTDPAPSPRA